MACCDQQLMTNYDQEYEAWVHPFHVISDQLYSYMSHGTLNQVWTNTILDGL